VAPILTGWGPVIRSLEVIPGTGGIFDIHLNGERIFTKSMIGRYPDPDDVLPLIRAEIGDEVKGR
jgi:selenoprotein W-related protein